MKAILKSLAKVILSSTPKTHEQRDNHKPGCWNASLVTTHQKG